MDVLFAHFIYLCINLVMIWGIFVLFTYIFFVYSTG